MKAVSTFFILFFFYCSSSFAARSFIDGLPIKVPKTIIPWLGDSHYVIDVDSELSDSTLEANTEIVEELNRMLQGGGKRVRPLLTFLAAGLVGLPPERVIEIARVSEFTHTASLIHDDILDKDDNRRGKVTTRGKFGDGPAVLMGDYLLALLTEEAVTHLPTKELVKELMKVIRGMSVGERLQAALLNRGNYSLEQYQEVIQEKTGVLFGWTMASPTSLLEKNPKFLSERFTAFAIALGELYQMRNDTDPKGYRKSEINYVRWLASRVNRKTETEAVKGPFTERMLKRARNQALYDMQVLGKRIQTEMVSELLRDSRSFIEGTKQVSYWRDCAATLRDIVDYLSQSSN
jgi:hypothetical protein